MAKTTQIERIIMYTKDFGSISPKEAFTDLGITKLATRVSEMKKDGYIFKQKYEKTKNRYGEDVRYMRYYLIGRIETRNENKSEKIK